MDYIMSSFVNIRISDVLDIAIVAFLTYKLINYIRRTRAMQLLKGLIIVLIVWALAELFGFTVVRFLISNFMTLGIIFLVIVFQPELRLGLEKLGRGGALVPSNFAVAKMDEIDFMIVELLDAIKDMAMTKTGAIIVIERDGSLGDIVETGESIDARVKSGLIKNIFFKNAPLHDGAMIIRETIIVAAACLLPLSRNQSISKDLGTRHRAALGLAERSDALIIVVSEETGTISVASEGKLIRFVDILGLESLLKSKLSVEKKPVPLMGFFGSLVKDRRTE